MGSSQITTSFNVSIEPLLAGESAKSEAQTQNCIEVVHDFRHLKATLCLCGRKWRSVLTLCQTQVVQFVQKAAQNHLLNSGLFPGERKKR